MPQSSKSLSPKSLNQSEQEQTASTLLSNLEAEIQTAQKYSADLREEAEGQTQKILENRAAQLEELEKTSAKRIEVLQIQEDQLKTSLKDQTSRRIELETVLVGLNVEVDARRALLGELDEHIAEQIKNSEDLKAKNTAILAQINDLQSQITPLQATIQQLRDTIDVISSKRDVLRDQLDDFRTEFEVLKADKQRTVTILESKREQLEVDIIQMQGEFESQREDLAIRIRAANDREEVLKRREVKVARDESDNRRNAQLMNL